MRHLDRPSRLRNTRSRSERYVPCSMSVVATDDHPRVDAHEVSSSRAELLELRQCLRGLQETFAQRSDRTARARATQMTARALGIAEGLVRAGEGSGPTPRQLRIGPRAHWFQLDGRERVSLQRRRALPGILLALAS